VSIRFVFFIGLLLCGTWPDSLLAYVPKRPAQSAPSSFLLIATPKLRDPRFYGSVVLVARRDEAGSVGIIVNRPHGVSLGQAIPDYPLAKDVKLFYGGPVNPHQLSFLVRSAETLAEALKVSEHLYLSGDMTLLGELLNGKRAHDDLRVMNGLAVWAPGQLEHEIFRKDWLVLPIDETVILDRPADELWQELYRRASDQFF
jgi:putative transcriptional regulator